jgi:hypothetical protein
MLPLCFRPDAFSTSLSLSFDNFHLFSPDVGSQAAFCVDGAGGRAEGQGNAWLVQPPGVEAEFVAATRFGTAQDR